MYVWLPPNVPSAAIFRLGVRSSSGHDTRPHLSTAFQNAYTRPPLVTRSDSGIRNPPAVCALKPCISVPGAGTAGAPAGALSVRRTNGCL